MWLATTLGFYSVVEHRNRSDAVLVRARVRADLERLLELDSQPSARPSTPDCIQSTPTADYPYRVAMHKRRWQHLAELLTKGVDYDNFKSAVANRQGPERARLYHELWHRLLELEREDPALRDAHPWRLLQVDIDASDPGDVAWANATAAVLEGIDYSLPPIRGHEPGCTCAGCLPF